MDSSSNAAMDFGRFMTGFLVLTGIGELLLFSLRHFAYQLFPIGILGNNYGKYCTNSLEGSSSVFGSTM